LKYALFSVKGI